MQHVGVVGVSSIGMFAAEATWLVPLSPTTVMVSVGSIVRRPIVTEGALQEREMPLPDRARIRSRHRGRSRTLGPIHETLQRAAGQR